MPTRGRNRYFAYRSFWKEPEARRRFGSFGTDTTCFFISNTTNSLGEPYCQYPPVWVADGSFRLEGAYDFGPTDAQIDDIVASMPNARLICMVDLNTPLWLQRLLNLDSMTELGCLCSDPEWRRVTARFMNAVLTHVEERCGDRIAAYVLSGGKTSEWYDHSNLRESTSRLKAWQQYLAQQGLPEGPIPGLDERQHVSFDGLLRDPQKDGDALRYIRFCAKQVTDAMAFFLSQARSIIRPEVELGVFYGYPLVLSGQRVILGNNDCSELLDNPDLDFFISPQGGFSATGQGGGELGPTETIQLRGKSYLRECDQRTHTFNRTLSEHVRIVWTPEWQTQAETVAGVKRELGCSLIKQASLWWFDMWGGFYDDPAVVETLEKSCKIYHQQIQEPVERVAEVALIVDPDSIPYLNQNDGSRTKWFYNQMKRALDLIGAPWECYHFEDIPHIPDPERIRFWLLPGIFELTPEKLAVLDQYVQRQGVTALYLYAPGISDGEQLDAARVEEFCGTAFGTPGVNAVEKEGYRSLYIHNGEEITAPLLRELAEAAGVHLYVDDDVSVYANSRFVSIHSGHGGVRTVRLPVAAQEIRELYSGEVAAQDCQSFDVDLRGPDTMLFSIK